MTALPSESPAGTPSPLPAPVREIGTAVDLLAGNWWTSLADEKVPELFWPQAYYVYDDMMRNAQVSSVIRAVIMPILRTGWRINGTDCREDITRHVADDLALPIVGEGNKLSDTTVVERFSWGEHLEIALEEYLGYGHSFYEQKAYLGRDGFWHLQKLGYRPPRTITRVNVARDGGLVSVEQSGGGSGDGYVSFASATPNKLAVNRLVVYVRGRKGGNWRGRSILRPAYQPWLLNQRAVRVEMITAERQGAPVVVYTAGEKETELDSGRAIATGVRAGQNAGAAIPHGAQLEQKGVDGQLVDVDKIKRYNDDQIARTVLAHFLNLGQQTGSWALGSTLGDFFTLSLQATADEIARTANRHIVRDLVDWNWPGERAPRLVFDEIGSRQEAIVSAIASLVTAKVLLPDEDLETFLRTALGLPPRGKPIPPAD